MPESQHAILAEVRRDNRVESLHFGSVAVVDAFGELIASAGDPDLITYMRSSAKPFQAMPLISSGAAARFNFEPEEIAIACGSHSGEPFHVQAVERMLRKIDLPTSALLCGVHEPYNRQVANELQRNGTAPSTLHNNCSGKHAGMLAVVRHMGLPLDTYIARTHPLQQRIRSVIAALIETNVTSIPFGIDGCGVPTWALSLKQMATLFARLSSPPQSIAEPLRSASCLIANAMTSHPEFVGGTAEFDTELMRTFNSAILSKVGAEGVWCAGVRPSGKWPDPLGIALKICDGSARARPTIALHLLEQLKIGDAHNLLPMRNLFDQRIKNNRGEVVGKMEAVVELNFC